MFELIIKPRELFNEATSEFITTKGYKLQLEHSLVSLTRWESKWKKPFLSRETKTFEETIDYIRCMTITQNIDSEAYAAVSLENIAEVNNYINDSMTATTITTRETKVNRDIITAEIIYFWMIQFNIPFECQKWHLNRLLTLINVCNIKNKTPDKMKRSEIFARQRELNAARKQKYKTTG